MKHLKLFKLTVSAALIVMTIAGCIKDNDNQPLPPISGLSFTNASPDAPSVNFYVSETRVNDNAIPVNGYLDYVNAYSGERDVFVYEGDTKKVTGKVTLEQGRMYSLFLTGKWQAAELIALEDSLAQPDPGKAGIRFLNMSVDAPSLDLGLNDGTKLINGKEYKVNSGYIAIDGDRQYNFVIRDHGSTTDKAVLPSVTLQSGRNYTIWARGIYTETGANGLGGEVTKNY